MDQTSLSDLFRRETEEQRERAIRWCLTGRVDRGHWPVLEVWGPEDSIRLSCGQCPADSMDMVGGHYIEDLINLEFNYLGHRISIANGHSEGFSDPGAVLYVPVTIQIEVNERDNWLDWEVVTELRGAPYRVPHAPAS